MPLSKPVKKQLLRLPSPKQFQLMSKELKESILCRLTVDNLVAYLEHIVCGYHIQNKNNCITLEQIVEDELKIDENCLQNSDLVSDWISKHANPSQNIDFESTLTCSASLEPPLSTFEPPSLSESLSQSHLDLTKPFVIGEISNFSKNFENQHEKPLFSSRPNNEMFFQSIQAPTDVINSHNLNSISNRPVGTTFNNQNRIKSAWEGSQCSNQYSRWQNVIKIDKEDVSLNQNLDGLSLSQINSSYFGDGIKNSSGNRNTNFMMTHDANFDDKSRFAQTNYKPLQSSALSNIDSFSPFTVSSKPNFVTSSASNFRTSMASMNYFDLENFKISPENEKLNQHQQMLSFTLKTTTSSPDQLKSKANFGCSANFDLLVKNQLPNSKPTKNDIESINLDSKDSQLFDSFKLPNPAQFNEMSYDNRIQLLSKLPSNVRNKYELFCWSSQVQNAATDRRSGADLSF